MTTKVDLTDLLDLLPEEIEEHRLKQQARPKPIPARRPALKHGEHAEETVVMFTEHLCSCGRSYQTPTYGDVMTRFGFYKRGVHTADIYRPYCAEVHSELPQSKELRSIHIQACIACHGK